MQKKIKYISENGKAELHISLDRFSAYLILKDKGIISENEILELIEKVGIKYGFNEIEEQRSTKRNFNEPFLIAKSPVEKEIKIEYLFNLNRTYSPLKTKSLMDFRKLEKVGANIPLAAIDLQKIEKNEQYYDVFGEPVTDEEIKDRLSVRFLGEQVYYSVEDSKIMSQKRGYPYIDEKGMISVKTDFEFSENLHKAKLDFYGNLVLNGNIDNSFVNVSGNLLVNGTIRNCLSNWVSATGKLEFKSAENSFIGSGESISFQKSSRYCLMVSDGEIRGGDESMIIGGSNRSSDSIEAANIGSSVPVNTVVEITVLPYIKEKLKQTTKEIWKIKKKHKKDLDELNNLIKRQRDLEKILEKGYLELSTAKNKAKITINRKLYKGTQLKIYNKRKTIVKNYEGVEVILNKDEIYFKSELTK